MELLCVLVGNEPVSVLGALIRRDKRTPIFITSI